MEQEAHRLLRRAHETAYRFPQGFGGFAASVYYAREGESWAGSLDVLSPSEILYGGTLAGADERLCREVGSVVSHRWHRPYEEADGRYRLALDAGEHPLGRLVRVEDGFESSYRVQGGRIQQVNRRMGKMRLSINIQERSFVGDGRALPSHFCVVYWDATEERVVRTDIYRDGYIPVGSMYLPLSRRITTVGASASTTTRQILLRDHRLICGHPAA